MLKIIGRVFAVIIALLVLLFIAYKILSSIPDYEIDATTIINLPQSPNLSPKHMRSVTTRHLNTLSQIKIALITMG
jgi:hypothetical protein